MIQKEIKTRLQHRHGTAEDWSKSSLIPLPGELIIYDKDSTHPYERFKIGDGITNVNNLKFVAGSDLKAGANITITSNATDGSLSIAATNTDTKVTSAANHYTPTADTNAALAADASSTTAATWNTTSLVTGVNIQRDSKGHITGLTLDSIKIPANPVSAAAVKTALGTGTGTTKFLREDGTWVVPPDNNTTYSNMTAATASAAGKAGLVPAPAAGKQESFLRGDGTWVVPTDTKVTQTATEPTSNTKWYPVCSASSSNNTSTTVKNTAFNVNVMQGTASTEGKVELILGNSTASGNAGNKTGSMTFYTSGSSYIYLKPQTTNTAKTLTLPAVTGTVGVQPTVNGTFVTSLTPEDNTVYHWSNMTGNLTINAPDYTVCTYYGAHIFLNVGSTARTLTLNCSRVSGDVPTTLPANTYWEISILRGRVIICKV